jgi:hypothetical protein
MSEMCEASQCPPVNDLNRVVQSGDYAEFSAGWRDGLMRCIKNPAPIEVIEDLALLLDSSVLVKQISPPE